MHDLDRLIEGARSLLAERGYSASTISHHERAWRRLGMWCRENGHSSYSRLVQDEYFRERGFDRRRLGKLESDERTQVRRLLEYAETGGFACAAASSPRSVPPEGMEAAAEGYRAHLEGKGLRRRTIAGYMVSVRQFCATCGASTPDRLSQASVARYIEGLGGYAAQTKASKLYAVRSFLRFLAGHGLCSGEAAECMPLIPGHRHSAVPSAYTASELSSILGTDAAAGRRSPKRDRAIMLLAGIVGMRASDIKGLMLQDIDWQGRALRFTQSKTGVPQALPIPEEVMLALADYIRSERHDTGSGRVFLTSVAPYRPIDSSHVFHRSVTRSFHAAGVPTEGKHHGLHSLRHSAATNMLASGVPYPTISSVLGHSSVNVTKRYLSIGTESLRCIALEVPLWEG